MEQTIIIPLEDMFLTYSQNLENDDFVLREGQEPINAIFAHFGPMKGIT